jgi:hypothetical protein
VTIEPKLMSGDQLREATIDAELGHLWSAEDVTALLAHIAAQDQHIAALRSALDVGTGLLESCSGRFGALAEYVSTITDLRTVRDSNNTPAQPVKGLR